MKVSVTISIDDDGSIESATRQTVWECPLDGAMIGNTIFECLYNLLEPEDLIEAAAFLAIYVRGTEHDMGQEVSDRLDVFCKQAELLDDAIDKCNSTSS